MEQEFVFESIDHAAATRQNRDRLTVCPECRQAIVAELTNDG